MKKLRNDYDFVGYEGLIGFIIKHKIISVTGDFIEIGAFLGAGSAKLAKFLMMHSPDKKLYVIDIFEPDTDTTKNTSGKPMNEIYHTVLKKYNGKSQWDIFCENVKSFSNIIVKKEDSKKVTIPSTISFGFIDGNHQPDYVENDFYLIWEKLSDGGCVAFRDYDWDLPQTTEKIDELIKKHNDNIRLVYNDKARHVVYLIKK